MTLGEVQPIITATNIGPESEGAYSGTMAQPKCLVLRRSSKGLDKDAAPSPPSPKRSYSKPGLFGCLKSRLISADLIVICEKK